MSFIRIFLQISCITALTACGSRSDLAYETAARDGGAIAPHDSGVSPSFDAGINPGAWPTHSGTLVATLGQAGDGIAFTSFPSPTSPQPAGTLRGAWQDSALQGVAFDTQGRLYVVEYQAVPTEPPGRVLVFERGHTSPSRIVGGTALGASLLTGVAVDTLGNIYVLRNDATAPTSGVVVFAPSSDTTPIRWIHGANTGLGYPNGLAVGTDGTLYVGNTDGAPVLVFAPDADGDAAPIASIGLATGPAGPEGVALDGTGRVYFTSTYPAPAVVVMFNGAIERMITGSATGLNAVGPLAVGADGRVYVGDYGGVGSEGFRVFAPGASGNVAPETIVGGSYGLGLAVSP